MTEEPNLITLDSENVIAFLEDYDDERVLLLTKADNPDDAEFEKNFRKAMKTQRTDVIFAVLSSDVDECPLVLEELKLKKENLPALCYMGIGKDLNVCRLSDSSVGYLEHMLRSLLESDESDESDTGETEHEAQVLKTMTDSMVSQRHQEKEEESE
ncbi:hypothetical protein GCK32_006735 [Trichostrongylus colubriformis]|uniref:Uncharacterized protein n=1 Tax=Trichostrongylus colubriformis TaxID=6319 RepID=A0AAN8J0H4_TRICO